MKKALLPSLVILFFAGISLVIPFEAMGNLFFASTFTRAATPPVVEKTVVPNTVITTPTSAKKEMLAEKDFSATSGTSEFFLAVNRAGTQNYTISSNTCAHGVRIIARAKGGVINPNMSVDLHIFGFSREKSRETFSNLLTLTPEETIKILHLPSSLIYLNESLFPEYQINLSRNSDLISYDVMCY
ncbi:hypothetical protein K9L27_03865 [Candidatus Gracilibacteria bacterium]|nr:hypothetical protein [Candidatus Gracilibacteria bacterium]